MNGVSADEFPSVAGTTLKNPVAVDAAKLHDMFEKTAFVFRLTKLATTSMASTLRPSVARRVTVSNSFCGDRRTSISDGRSSGRRNGGGWPSYYSTQGHPGNPKGPREKRWRCLRDIREGFFTLGSGPVTIGVRLVDGQFPDYRQVIPVNTTTTLDISRDELLSAVRRVSLVTTDKSKTIKFRAVAGNLVISSSSPEYGEASESSSQSKSVRTSRSGSVLATSTTC